MFVPHHEGHAVEAHSHEMVAGFAEMSSFGKMQVIFMLVTCLVEVLVFIKGTTAVLDAAAFSAQIKKLLAANNPERALKLCSATPKTAAAFIARAGIEARMRGEDAYAKVSALYPQVLSAQRSMILPALILGAVTVADGSVLLGEDGFDNLALIPLIGVVAFGAANAWRYSTWPRELTRVCDVFR